MSQYYFITVFSLSILIACAPKKAEPVVIEDHGPADTLRYDSEKHLRNIRQLTFGGDNAEAYWSYDGTKLTFQATQPKWNATCDQIFMINVRDTPDSTKTPALISTGKGRTTCSYFLPGDSTIIHRKY